MAKKLVSIFFLLIFLTGCSTLQPKIINTKNLALKERLVFNANLENVSSSIEEFFQEKEWTLYYSDEKRPTKSYSYFSNAGAAPFDYKNYDTVAWNQNSLENLEPKYFITGKTPTTITSFGAELFIVLYSLDKKTIVQASIATSQLAEKNKLEKYLTELTEVLNKKLN